MGCDFCISIQILYDGEWIDVVRLDSRTGCGGHPLAKATFDLAQATGIVGNYKTQYESVEHNTLERLLKYTVKENTRCAQELANFETKMPRNENVEDVVGENTGLRESGDEDEEPEIVSLYYSKNQFAELVNVIVDLADEHVRNSGYLHFLFGPYHGDPKLDKEHNIYGKRMAPVAMWCDMALTAIPLLGARYSERDIWLSEDQADIDAATSLLRARQQQMLELHTSSLLTFLTCGEQQQHEHGWSGLGMFACLSRELLEMIAAWCAPRGSDVRVAWSDDEGHCDKLRDSAHQYISSSSCPSASSSSSSAAAARKDDDDDDDDDEEENDDDSDGRSCEDDQGAALLGL